MITKNKNEQNNRLQLEDPVLTPRRTVKMTFQYGQEGLQTKKQKHEEMLCFDSYSLNPDGEGIVKDDRREDSEEQDTLSWKSETDSEKTATEVAFKPLVELFNAPSAETFVIDTQGGLTGTSVLAKFPCMAAQPHFFVWLGTTEVELFGRSTLMNLANLAEAHACAQMFILVEKDHPDMKAYLKMFRVIDAEKMHSAEVQPMLREGIDAKKLDVSFYRIDL